jgi:hypothetical protein
MKNTSGGQQMTLFVNPDCPGMLNDSRSCGTQWCLFLSSQRQSIHLLSFNLEFLNLVINFKLERRCL